MSSGLGLVLLINLTVCTSTEISVLMGDGCDGCPVNVVVCSMEGVVGDFHQKRKVRIE